MDPKEYTDQVYTVTIRSTETVYEQDLPVSAVSSKNVNGPFDVLPLHADCISIVEDYLAYYPQKGERKLINIHKGVLRVENGNVYIFLDTLTK